MTTSKRSPSPPSVNSSKKSKPNAPKSFLPTLFDPSVIPSLNETYRTSTPYTHAVVGDLFQDDLLRRVKEEVSMKSGDDASGLGGLVGWGSKETDIYKINQSFDLSSLTPEHLPEATLAKLPALQELRDALYCPEFRTWVREVTGCGPLSQQKVDGSVSRYTKGCHLLLHDDVISTRRISWILYLPSANWQANPTWGGALELYPATTPSPPTDRSSSEADKPRTWRDEVGSDVIPGKTIHPKWGQFVFFEVQPGKSYHSVEEVVIGEGKERLSISGWFHKPVEGEEGYEGKDEGGDLSSLKQITHQSLSTVLTPYPASDSLPMPGTTLSASEVTFLKRFLHPQYLQPSTLSLLSTQFGENSFLMLDKFLHPSLAGPLEVLLAEQDKKDGLEREARGGLIPQQTAGSEMEGWEIVGPSTRQRFLSLTSPSSSTTSTPPSATQMISSILHELLPSTAFRSWLAMLTSLLPLAHKLEARRFRPGLDYTLARGEEEDSRLDVRLGLTPGEKWEDIEGGEQFGGWECYLAPPDENEDPAVYQSSKPKPVAEKPTLAASSAAEPTTEAAGQLDDAASDADSDSPDDAPLLTSQPAFNSLLLVMRDPQVMKFTKYMSAGAPCCRWDVGGEWEVGMVEEEEEEDA